MCEHHYGVCPGIIIDGHKDASFSHFPSPLEYILLELLKNAMRWAHGQILEQLVDNLYNIYLCYKVAMTTLIHILLWNISHQVENTTTVVSLVETTLYNLVYDKAQCWVILMD